MNIVGWGDHSEALISVSASRSYLDIAALFKSYLQTSPCAYIFASIVMHVETRFRLSMES